MFPEVDVDGFAPRPLEVVRFSEHPLALTFDCVFVAAGRQPSGFASLIRPSPDGLRRSANKVSAILPLGERQAVLYQS